MFSGLWSTEKNGNRRSGCCIERPKWVFRCDSKIEKMQWLSHMERKGQDGVVKSGEDCMVHKVNEGEEEKIETGKG